MINATLNSTGHPDGAAPIFPSLFQTVSVKYHVLLYVLGTLIIFLNGIIVVYNLRRAQESDAFCTNLAFADIFDGSLLILYASNYLFKHRLRHGSCLVLLGTFNFPGLLSASSILLIAFDRYIYIVKGIYYSLWVTRRTCFFSIASVWIVTILIAFAPAMGWSLPKEQYHGCFPEMVFTTGYMLLTLTLFVLVPLIIAIFLYVRIYVAVKRVKLQIISQIIDVCDRSTRKRKCKVNAKAAFMIISIIGTFLLTWGSCFVFMTKTVLYDDDDEAVQRSATHSAIILAFANSLLNPITFFYWDGFLCRQLKRFLFRSLRRRGNAVAPNTVRNQDVNSSPDRTTSGR
ncbi:Uncharacterised protein g5515 [Pycnogonum litorale]